MAQKRLFDPTNQFQVRSGALNVNGRLRVYYNNTDDLALVYDDNGSAVAQPVILDANGRAPGLFVDDTRMYRLEAYDLTDHLLFTIPDMAPMGAAGGSVTTITSSDDSITVVQEGNNVDLSVNTQEPSVLLARSAALSSDGLFNFTRITKSGSDIDVIDSRIFANKGWYHYDLTVKLSWTGADNKVERVRFSSPNASTAVDFDLSYAHDEYLQLDGEYKCMRDNTQFSVVINDMPSGMSATVTNAGMHSILGMTGGGSGGIVEQVQSDWTCDDEYDPAYILHKPEELSASLDSGTELVAGDNITLESTAAGVVISSTASGGETPWTYTEDTTFEVTVTADEVTSSFFERLVPITNQDIVNSGKDFVMIYQCQVEADSVDPPSIPDMTPIGIDVYNYPNHLIDEINGIYTSLGGAALQSFSSHGSVVLGRQMLAAGRLFTVCFPRNVLTVGDKFILTVRAVYIELTGVN